MQVNPTTAHPCANTSLNSKTDSLIQKINEAPEWALPMIDSVIEAFAFHETSGIEAIIANPEAALARLLLVGDEFIGVSA